MATSFSANWFTPNPRLTHLVISHPADDEGGIVLTYNQAKDFLDALTSWRLAPGRPYCKDPEFPERGLKAEFKGNVLSLSKDKDWLGIDPNEVPDLIARLRELV